MSQILAISVLVLVRRLTISGQSWPSLSRSWSGSGSSQDPVHLGPGPNQAPEHLAPSPEHLNPIPGQDPDNLRPGPDQHPDHLTPGPGQYPGPVGCGSEHLDSGPGLDGDRPDLVLLRILTISAMTLNRIISILSGSGPSRPSPEQDTDNLNPGPGPYPDHLGPGSGHNHDHLGPTPGQKPDKLGPGQ